MKYYEYTIDLSTQNINIIINQPTIIVIITNSSVKSMDNKKKIKKILFSNELTNF